MESFSSQQLAEAVRQERIRNTQRCADICLYRDIDELPIPPDWKVNLDDIEAVTRAQCAAAILETLKEIDAYESYY